MHLPFDPRHAHIHCGRGGRGDDRAPDEGGQRLAVGEQAEAIAEKVRLAAQTPAITSSGSITASLSIGVTIRAPGEDVDSVIARADLALYQAKRSGRNRVVAVPVP